MKSVYLVTSGEYSDYQIIAAYSSKAKAEKCVAFIKDYRDEMGFPDYRTDANIEEWPIDAEMKMQKYMVVFIARDGTVLHITRMEEIETKAEEWSGMGKINLGGESHSGLRVRVYTENENRAVKVANETRVQRIAQGEWK